MRYFTDANDGFYCIAPELWPQEGWTEITAEQAQAYIAAPDPAAAIQAQIEALERQQLMPRATREFMLMFMEANASAEVLAVNPGYLAVKQFDNQIVALRGQLP